MELKHCSHADLHDCARKALDQIKANRYGEYLDRALSKKKLA